MRFYELIVNPQKQKGGGALSNEPRIVIFVGRFKDNRGEDRIDRSPQEKVSREASPFIVLG
jgi:hypothetical protein